MSANIQLGDAVKVLANAKEAITDAATETFVLLDGAGNDDGVYLPGVDGYESTDRIVVVFTSTRVAGTTSVITFGVEDSEGTPTVIGTPAAVPAANLKTNLDDDSLELGNADGVVVVGVEVQTGRPWLRLTVTSDDATDDVVCTATVLAIPAGI
jgi:hypothetical protein